jgi:hypothetical protein
MLAVTKPGRIFREGCALPVIARRFLATRPHRRLPIREWFYPSTVSGDSRRSESLFTAPVSCAWQQAQRWETRPSSAS